MDHQSFVIIAILFGILTPLILLFVAANVDSNALGNALGIVAVSIFALGLLAFGYLGIAYAAAQEQEEVLEELVVSNVEKENGLLVSIAVLKDGTSVNLCRKLDGYLPAGRKVKYIIIRTKGLGLEFMDKYRYDVVPEDAGAKNTSSP